MVRKRHSFVPVGRVLALIGLALATGAAARPPGPASEQDDLERAGDIAIQPVRDVGISKEAMPNALREALAQPYAPPKRTDCAWINWELARLDRALGPDFDADKDLREDRAKQLAFAGGEMVVNSLIPFRGLVREVSGAAPADRRMTSAINAGLARRGYMRGVAEARGCRAPVRLTAR